ncbi:MAG TPA: hypothetical protein VF144_12740, partial [Chitinophagaceae bacterium]
RKALRRLKNNDMKRPAIVITIATLYLLFFHVSPHIGIPEEAIIAMFILSPFLVIYMAYVILRYGKPSKYTFDEKFYEDHEYRRDAT